MGFVKLLSKKRDFLLQVYALIMFQLAITALMVWFVRQNSSIYAISRKLFFLWLILLLVLVYLLSTNYLPLPVKLILFTLMSVILGMNMIAASRYVSVETIKSAIVATLGIFIAMSALALVLAGMGVDLSFMSFVLFVALLGLIIAWIVTIFIKPSNQMVRALLMVGLVLFSIFIAYDTNVIIMTDTRDVIQGAVGLYLDIINVFSNLVGLDS